VAAPELAPRGLERREKATLSSKAWHALGQTDAKAERLNLGGARQASKRRGSSHKSLGLLQVVVELQLHRRGVPRRLATGRTFFLQHRSRSTPTDAALGAPPPLAQSHISGDAERAAGFHTKASSKDQGRPTDVGDDHLPCRSLRRSSFDGAFATTVLQGSTTDCRTIVRINVDTPRRRSSSRMPWRCQ
jgi:hypothetical protein